MAEHAVRRVTRGLHRGLNALIFVGLVLQFYAAGWAAFGMPFTLHRIVGWSLLGASLVLSLLSGVGHGLAIPTRLSTVLVLVLLMQPILVFGLSSVSVALSALHPVNGLLALYLVGLTEYRLRNAALEDHPIAERASAL